MQALITIVGRVMLCTIFLMSAVGKKIPDFNGVAEEMTKHGVPQPKIMLAGAIVFLIVGSISVVLGYWARLGATLLLAFLILATYYFHAFWAAEPKDVELQTINFMKNLGLAGAMLMIVGSGAGRGSIDALRAARRDEAG